MIIRRFHMEDWLASYKDTCRYNLGESGMPDISVGDLLERCGRSPESLSGIVLKDHDSRGTERLRSAIADSYGDDVPFDNITVTTGTSEALFILFNLLLDNRTSVVAPFPAFQALYEVPRALGADMRFYRMDEANGYRPDPGEIETLIDDTTAAVIINTPHNPSGVLCPDDTARQIIETADRHGAAVISDEHYRYLPHSGPPPLRTLARYGGNIIATGSVTKCFGLIGLRVGWIACDPGMIPRIRDFRDYLTHTLSPVSDYLATLALEHRDTFIKQSCNILRTNASTLINAVDSNPDLSMTAPEAGVVAFPRYHHPLGSDELAKNLIERYGVFVLPGSSFEVEGHIRINLGQPTAVFTKSLDHIQTLLRDMR